MPADIFTHSETTVAPPAIVWSGLQKADSWKAIGGIQQISDARYDDEQLSGFGFVSTVAGRPYRGTANTASAIIGEEMVVDVDTSELTARLTVALKPAHPTGTTLDVTMRLHSKGFLASMMWGLIATTVGAGLGDRVREMTNSFEAPNDDDAL